MLKLYRFFERYIFNKNRFLFYLKSCLFFLLISILLNIFLEELIDIPIEENTTSSALNKYSIWVRFVMLCILHPLFETILFQALPIYFYTMMKPNSENTKSDFIFAIIASLVFGCVHGFSIAYCISAGLIGFMYLAMGLALERKGVNYLIPIFTVHFFNNFFVFVASTYL